MSNTSATGGYLLPSSTAPIPGGLTLNQFIQTVLVGISGLTPTLVRPKWQPSPPKMPDIGVNWLAYGVTVLVPDANAWVGMDADGNQISQRHRQVNVGLSFYGPDAVSYAEIVTDGFQITQNLEALRLANMGYIQTTPMFTIPDLINERWFNRIEMEVHLRREVDRTYAVLPLVGAEGTIESDAPEYSQNWQTPGDN